MFYEQLLKWTTHNLNPPTQGESLSNDFVHASCKCKIAFLGSLCFTRMMRHGQKKTLLVTDSSFQQAGCIYIGCKVSVCSPDFSAPPPTPLLDLQVNPVGGQLASSCRGEWHTDGRNDPSHGWVVRPNTNSNILLRFKSPFWRLWHWAPVCPPSLSVCFGSRSAAHPSPPLPLRSCRDVQREASSALPVHLTQTDVHLQLNRLDADIKGI